MTLKTRARAVLTRHGIAATITGFAAMAIFAAAAVGAYRFGYQAGGQLFGRIAVGFLLISGILVYLTVEATPADPEDAAGRARALEALDEILPKEGQR